MSLCRVAPALAALSLGVAPAQAHHAFTLYDLSRSETLEGTIKAFEWTNPHTLTDLVVHDTASGRDGDWSIEGGSPNGLTRFGWTSDALKPGDKAVIVVHPRKDGTRRGLLVTATVDGKTYGVRAR